MTDFAAFIAPLDANVFKNNYFGKRPVHIPRSGKPFANPLPWAKFNAILNQKPFWNEETMKVFFKSRGALPENYCDVSGESGGRLRPIDPKKVQSLLGLGASLVANHVHKVSSEVEDLARMLQHEFASRCGANVYCSFKQVQAFNTHFDLHDVFALQVEGEKQWHVYEARADNPILPVPPGDEAEKWLISSRGKPILTPVMKPGDLMYLPRGQYHDAITGDGASLHVTFSLEPATGLSIFKLLEGIAARESEFRAYLPHPNDQAALKSHLAKLGRTLDALINSNAFAIDMANHQLGLPTHASGFNLPSQAKTRFVSPAVRAQIVRKLDGFTLLTENDEISIGAPYPAIAWLFQQRVCSLADLASRFPFVNEKALHELVDQLIKKGVLVETEMR